MDYTYCRGGFNSESGCVRLQDTCELPNLYAKFAYAVCVYGALSPTLWAPKPQTCRSQCPLLIRVPLPQGARPAPRSGLLRSSSGGTDDRRFRALLPRSGTEEGTPRRQPPPPPCPSGLRRAPPTGPSGDTLAASLSLRLRLRLRNAAERPALAPLQPCLGLAFFGVTPTQRWGGAAPGIFPIPGPPLLQRLLLRRSRSSASP